MTLLNIPLLVASFLHIAQVHHNHSICEANISRLQQQIRHSEDVIQDLKTLLDVEKGKETLLLQLSEKGNLAMVKKLLALHTNISAQDSRLRTPLHLASSNGHLEIVRALLDDGANTEIRNIHNNTPLIGAAHNNHLEVCRLLLDRGAQLNVSDIHGNTPLHYSAWFGYLPVVQLLVERGADVNTKNTSGETPAQLAMNGGKSDVVTWLEKHCRG